MLDILIIFVKLRHNRFVKNIFESTLCCTVSTAGEVHETVLSITKTDLETLHLIRCNSMLQ